MTEAHRTYIPASGHDWALPLYDPMVRLLGGDSARRGLIRQAALQPGHRALEIGCGTGSLLISIKREHPGVEVVGLDPDPKALERAKRKAASASLSIGLDRGFSDALPYPDGSFDRVLSCFMFHHLEGADQKLRTLREARRVLGPGGRLHLLDFVTAGSPLMRRLHPHMLEHKTEGQILGLMREAGFREPRVVQQSRLALVFRTAYYEAPVA